MLGYSKGVFSRVPGYSKGVLVVYPGIARVCLVVYPDIARVCLVVYPGGFVSVSYNKKSRLDQHPFFLPHSKKARLSQHPCVFEQGIQAGSASLFVT